MRLIDPSVEMIKCDYKDFDDVTKMIEKAGRICYKSEHKITADSHIDFIAMLIKRGHYSPLEHGTIYLKIVLPWSLRNALGDSKYKNKYDIISFYENNEYSRVVRKTEYIDDVPYGSIYYITTNYRVLQENDRTDDIKYLSVPEADHIKRYSFKIICDRGVGNEIVRHRKLSFCQESTRYCNYAYDNFGNTITFIKPYWYYDNVEGQACYMKACEEIEDHYLWMIQELKMSPQQARQILPLGLKTELVVTGFSDDWEHFLSLRTASSAHPDMQIIANEIKDYLYEMAEENKKE